MTFPRPGDVDVESIDVPTLPEDTLLIADKLTAEIALLEQLVQATINQQNPAPNLLRFFGAVGAQSSNIYNDTVRYRGVGLLITPASGAIITLRVGTSTAFVFDFTVNNETRFYPYPDIFEPGVDISFTSSAPFAGLGFYAMLVAFPETNP